MRLQLPFRTDDQSAKGIRTLTYSMRTRTPGRLAAQAVTVVPESPRQSVGSAGCRKPPEAAGNTAAGSLRAGAGTTGSQQTVCRTSASPPASSWSCSGAVPARPLVGPEHYREGCDW